MCQACESLFLIHIVNIWNAKHMVNQVNEKKVFLRTKTTIRIEKTLASERESRFNGIYKKNLQDNLTCGNKQHISQRVYLNFLNFHGREALRFILKWLREFLQISGHSTCFPCEMIFYVAKKVIFGWNRFSCWESSKFFTWEKLWKYFFFVEIFWANFNQAINWKELGEFHNLNLPRNFRKHIKNLSHVNDNNVINGERKVKSNFLFVWKIGSKAINKPKKVTNKLKYWEN